MRISDWSSDVCSSDLLLALDDTSVAGQQARLLQGRTVGLDVDRVQRPGHAETQRAGLAGDAAAVDAGDDVEAPLELQGGARLVHDLLVPLVREVGVQGNWKRVVLGKGVSARVD